MEQIIKKMVAYMVLGAIIIGCASTTTREDVMESHTHDFKGKTPTDVLNATKLAVKQLDWSINDEGDKALQFLVGGVGSSLTSDSELAWKNVAPDAKSTNQKFIGIRTPMSVFSFGAHLYISIYQNNNSTYMRMAGSTSQITEKKKIPQHLQKLYQKIKSNLE
jgi:hypothetical protein